MIMQGYFDNFISSYSDQGKDSQSSTTLLPLRYQSSYLYEDSEDNKSISCSLLKKIKKLKKKSSASSQNSQSDEQTIQRQCLMKLEKPILSSQIFLLPGFVIVELVHGSHKDFMNYFKQVMIQQVEKKDGSITAKASIQGVSQDYDMIVNLLERRQNIVDYEMAQMIKQQVQNEKKQAKKIQQIKDLYQHDFDMLCELQYERARYRNEQINQYIKQNYTEDDFYYCFDIGTNFQSNWTCPSFFKLSTNNFAIFGIEEDNLHNFLTKKDVFMSMLPPHSRKTLSWATLKLQTSENNNNGNNKITLKDFELITIDHISLYCNTDISFLKINYPKNLQYINSDSEQLDFEGIQFMQFHLTPHNIQQIISKRCYNTNIPQIEDIEYSVFSQVFLDKYYSDEVKRLNKDILEESNSEEQQKIEQELEKKTCNFRLI